MSESYRCEGCNTSHEQCVLFRTDEIAYPSAVKCCPDCNHNLGNIRLSDVCSEHETLTSGCDDCDEYYKLYMEYLESRRNKCVKCREADREPRQSMCKQCLSERIAGEI